MRIAALIVEQLDEDGLLKTFRTKPTPNHELIVAFPNEYDEPRQGPFHFLDPKDEERFAEGFANCAIRKVAASRFFHQGDFMVFTTEWKNIPTQKDDLSMYALLLPVHAVVHSVHFAHPRPG